MASGVELASPFRLFTHVRGRVGRRSSCRRCRPFLCRRCHSRTSQSQRPSCRSRRNLEIPNNAPGVCTARPRYAQRSLHATSQRGQVASKARVSRNQDHQKTGVAGLAMRTNQTKLNQLGDSVRLVKNLKIKSGRRQRRRRRHRQRRKRRRQRILNQGKQR